MSLFSQSPAVRKLAARDLTAFLAAQSTIMGLIALSSDDVSVELDPRSAQSWKLRYKDTYIDISAGYQPLIRYAANFFWGKKSQSGWVSKRRPGETTWRFGLSKSAPIVSAIYAALEGRTFVGEEIPEGIKGLPKQLEEMLMPMMIDSMIEAGMEYGTINGVILATPELFGGGVATYDTSLSVVQDHYSIMSQLEELSKKWKDAQLASDFETMKKLEEDHPELLMEYDPARKDYFSMSLRKLRRYASDIYELNRRLKEVELNPELDAQQRRLLTEELERQKAEVSTRAILDYEGLYKPEYEDMELPELLPDTSTPQTWTPPKPELNPAERPWEAIPLPESKYK
jgi:hypothetical protein